MTSSVHSFSNKTEMLGSLLGTCLFFTGRYPGRGPPPPAGRTRKHQACGSPLALAIINPLKLQVYLNHI
jgi:hypothetical protein